MYTLHVRWAGTVAAWLLGGLAVLSCAVPGRTPPPVPAQGAGAAKEALVVRKEANPEYVCVVPDAVLKETLTPLQFQVTRQGGTEAPFANEYWNNHEPGIYVDIIDGTPLFASTAKYDSGTGWPSFWQPLDQGALDLIEDRSHGMLRIEVRSKSSGAHLGHLFDDGPDPTGLRYCMNSASLRFIPHSALAAEGLSRYDYLFR